MTFALPASKAPMRSKQFTPDPFIHQEMIEILYHTLWESVHVFLEHRELGHDVGRRRISLSVSWPGKTGDQDLALRSRRFDPMKVQDDSKLRAQVAREQAEQIGNAALAIHERLAKGGKLILFGNGGSATDANDWAIDCVLPPSGYRPIPAVSLSMEPANITARRQRRRHGGYFPAPTHRAGAAGGRCHRHLHQRRLAQHHHGAGRSAQAQPA